MGKLSMCLHVNKNSVRLYDLVVNVLFVCGIGRRLPNDPMKCTMQYGR